MSTSMSTPSCQVHWGRAADAGPHLMEFLDSYEQAKLTRFVREQDRARYLVSHALARLATADALSVPPAEVRFTRSCRHCGDTSHGKPQAPGPLELSITHSGDRVAVAVSAHAPVGVDVEWLKERHDPDALASTVLTYAEQADLASLPASARHRGFLRYWTRKEAVLKATGDGLMIAPNTVAVTAPDQQPRLVAWPGVLPEMQLTDIDPDGDHVGCLAVLSPSSVTVTEHHDPFVRFGLPA